MKTKQLKNALILNTVLAYFFLACLIGLFIALAVSFVQGEELGSTTIIRLIIFVPIGIFGEIKFFNRIKELKGEIKNVKLTSDD